MKTGREMGFQQDYHWLACLLIPVLLHADLASCFTYNVSGLVFLFLFFIFFFWLVVVKTFLSMSTFYVTLVKTVYNLAITSSCSGYAQPSHKTYSSTRRVCWFWARPCSPLLATSRRNFLSIIPTAYQSLLNRISAAASTRHYSKVCNRSWRQISPMYVQRLLVFKKQLQASLDLATLPFQMFMEAVRMACGTWVYRTAFKKWVTSSSLQLMIMPRQTKRFLHGFIAYRNQRALKKYVCNQGCCCMFPALLM